MIVWKKFKAVRKRYVFLAGLIFGCFCTVGAIGYLWFDFETKSSAIIGQLRAEQQRSEQLNQSISNGLTDSLAKLGKAQGLAEKNSILFGELRAIVKLLPDGQ